MGSRAITESGVCCRLFVLDDVKVKLKEKNWEVLNILYYFLSSWASEKLRQLKQKAQFILFYKNPLQISIYAFWNYKLYILHFPFATFW